MAYDDNNSGALFTNDRKNTGRHPDFNGVCKIDGVEYFVSGWTNVARSGKREGQEYLSLKFNPKDQQPQGGSPSGGAFSKMAGGKAAGKPGGKTPPENFNDFDDDVPFD